MFDKTITGEQFGEKVALAGNQVVLCMAILVVMMLCLTLYDAFSRYRKGRTQINKNDTGS